MQDVSPPPERDGADAANARGIAAMLASMAAFTANDVCVKLASERVPLGEIIFLRNGFATLFLAAALFMAYRSIDAVRSALGLQAIRSSPGLARLLSWRMAGEVFATLLFLAALIRMPIADITAIGQFTPLAVTAAAAVFLNEPVGWRRWMAALAGLVGVLLIVRPGSTAFTPAALLALGSIGFVVLRDLATRLIPAAAMPTVTLTLMSASSVTVSGLLLMPFETWVRPLPGDFLLLMTAGFFLLGAYAFIIVAMRAGEVAVIAPFRYSVIIWAIAAGHLFWNELPDQISCAGIVIVIAAGLYTFHRERLKRRFAAERMTDPTRVSS